jgi:phosphonate transport system substrate-binding protein
VRALKSASCMAENSETTCREIAGYVAGRLGIVVEFVDNIPWQERESLFDRGDIQVLWICGLPYVRKSDLGEPPLDLLAAPVAEGDRYENKPLYFSDIVVHRDSEFHAFADLRGASWAYNESRSHSGYNVIRHYLATLGRIRRLLRTGGGIRGPSSIPPDDYGWRG